MKHKLGLRISLTLITLVAIASFVMVAYNLTNSSKTNNMGNGAISLEAPLFTSVAEAASKAAGAFPEKVAGISAYVNTGQTIDIEEMKTVFSEVEEAGDNYIFGIIPIPDFGGDIDVHLYADSDGWIVAYLKGDEPAAKIVQWGEADVNNPKIGVIKSTLEDALHKAIDAAKIVILSTEIKYYDFKFPDANRMTLFIKTIATDGANTAQVEVPANYGLYEASYYHYIYYKAWDAGDYWDSKLKVDETTISDAPPPSGSRRNLWWRAIGSYKGAITPGTLHKIELSYEKIGGEAPDVGSAGVATVLIYKAE